MKKYLYLSMLCFLFLSCEKHEDPAEITGEDPYDDEILYADLTKLNDELTVTVCGCDETLAVVYEQSYQLIE